MTTLDLGTLHVRYKVDKDGLRRELRDSEQEVKQSGDRSGRSILETAMRWAANLVRGWGDAGHKAGDGFWRSADGRLRDARGRFVAAGRSLGDALGEAASDATGTLIGLFGKLGGAASSLTGGIGMLVLVLGALAAAMAFGIPLVYAFGGALAALPAITTGGIAALGTLLIGFIGLSDAFKKTTSSGGAMVDRARQIALAERRVADANREVLTSQLALNRARHQAAERMGDLTRNLAGAHLDERDALAAVTAARRDLERAKEGDNPEQIDAATRAYERAQHQLAEVQDRVGDLQLEHEEAAKAGVEGSDEVQAALERQRKATEAVTDATYDLKRAQKPAGGGGAAAEVTKLAGSAMAAVAAIKSLKSQFEELRLDIQGRLFAGTDVEIKSLWAAWLPTLRTRLGSMADMFNGLFKTWATTSKNPEFIANIAAGWQHVERLIDRVGKAVAEPGLNVFGKLSAAAGPFLDMLGDKLGGVVERFADWIDRAERSGALQEFFEKATKFFGDLWDLGGDVVGLMGEFFSMWTDSENGAGAVDLFDAIRNGIRDLREWLKDPENRENLKNFIDGFVLLGTITMAVLGWLIGTGIPATWNAMERLDKAISATADKASDFRDRVTGAIDSVTNAINGMPSRIAGAASSLFDPLKNGFRAAMNWIIGKWNGLSFTLPGFSVFGQQVGGGTFGTIPIPMLKDGGLVKATPGGRMVGVAEAGEDEIVSPVAQMRQIVAEELARVQAERGPTYIEIPIEVGGEVVRVVRAEIHEHDRKVKRSETAGAGTR